MTKRKTSRTTPVHCKFLPVQKHSISDRIVQQIVDLIASGAVKAGDRLPTERDLCERFSAGRSSVREALRCLSIMVILTAKVGEGTSVAMDGSKFLEKVLEWKIVTEQHDIENLMEVRVALESVGAASAAQHRSDAQLKRMNDLLLKMEHSTADARQFAGYDLDFHLELAKASGNSLIEDLISMIRGQLARTIAKILLLPKEIPSSLKEHKAIYLALKKGDPEAARAAVQTHLNSTVQRYRRALGEKKLSA